MPAHLSASNGDQSGSVRFVISVQYVISKVFVRPEDDKEWTGPPPGAHLTHLDRMEARVTGSQASLGTRELGLEAGGRMDKASSLAALAHLEDDIKVTHTQRQTMMK